MRGTPVVVYVNEVMECVLAGRGGGAPNSNDGRA
jgi:hypothetical protein